MAKKTVKKIVKKSLVKKAVMKKAKPTKKVSKKVAKKTAKKATKKVAKKLVKKLSKKVVKKPVAKKSKKKVAKKVIASDYSNITFEQPAQDNSTIKQIDELSVTNTKSSDFITRIRENARKANQNHPVVHMKCRRGFDKASHGQSCKSMRAYKLSPDGSNNVMFTCVDCGFSWSVSLGGSINI
jgi:hypothetical protein